jgi:hypothetical protein
MPVREMVLSGGEEKRKHLPEKNQKKKIRKNGRGEQEMGWVQAWIQVVRAKIVCRSLSFTLIWL